ncbi:MAG: DUF4214 domain-containing protein [Pseudomonadota bacterium]
MMLEFDEVVGNSGDDTLSAAFFQIAFGLQGNDTLTSGTVDGFSVLAGGTGDDFYRVRFGENAALYDTAGNDAVRLEGIAFSSDDAYVAQIQGRHLAVVDFSTGTTAYWLDFRNSTINNIILDDVTLSKDFIAQSVTSLPGYLGNFAWEEIVSDAAAVINNRVFDATFPTIISRAAELEALASGSITTEDARFVVYLYEAALNRNGGIDLGGINFWIDQREMGLSVRGLAAELITSQEFTDNFGPVTVFSDQGFIEVLYRNVLNREGESNGVDFWTNRLGESDFDRLDAVIAFAGSDENRAASTFVETLNEVDSGFWAFS